MVFETLEDEIWVEKAIDIGSGTAQAESTPKTRNSIKNSAAYKANCLTPRSCPGEFDEKLSFIFLFNLNHF